MLYYLKYVINQCLQTDLNHHSCMMNMKSSCKLAFAFVRQFFSNNNNVLKHIGFFYSAMTITFLTHEEGERDNAICYSPNAAWGNGMHQQNILMDGVSWSFQHHTCKSNTAKLPMRVNEQYVK